MTIENKIARLIYPEYRFNTTKIEDAIKLVKMGVGGFCLYGGSRDEIYETINILRENASWPLIFAADYENGAGQWIKEGTLLASNMAICASGNSEFARKKAEITAIESSALGVDWVFAPVLDLAYNHDNPIVNLRAFSDSVEKTVEFADKYMEGLSKYNILNSIKHFPGHGDTSLDSHLTLPEINKDISEILNLDFLPFEKLSQKADSIMVGHLKINSIDDMDIASFSKKVITNLIRKKLNYDSIVLTDALSMKAIKDENMSALKALSAGCDILLVPEQPFRLYDFLVDAYRKNLINPEIIDMSIRRQDKLVAKRKASKFKFSLKDIGLAKYKEFNREIAPFSLTWIKKDINRGKKVYIHEFINDGEKSKAIYFIDAMRASGFEIKDNPAMADFTVILSFSKPRAYSGKINLGSAEKESIDGVIKNSKYVSMISFGSPFIFDSYINEINSGICCFGDNPEFQFAAAMAIKGELEIKGVLPVRIGK
jgi:beta-glucosidase